MYEDGIRVLYRVEDERGSGATTHVDLPGWCAGDPGMALALYLFGTRDAEDAVHVQDWMPL